MRLKILNDMVIIIYMNVYIIHYKVSQYNSLNSPDYIYIKLDSHLFYTILGGITRT